MSDDFKVIEGYFGKKQKEEEKIVMASEVLEAAVEMAKTAEEEGVLDGEVTIIYQMKGVPSITFSNTDMIRLPYLLDLAKQDVLTYIWAEDCRSVAEDDDDDTIH